MDSFTLAEFAKNSENKEDASFTPQVQEAGIEQGALIVSRLYNTMLGEITKTMKSWNAELTKVLEEGGITPSASTNEQLYNAILRIINRTHGRNIGDVYYSQSGSAEDNPGALPLFTGEIVSNASNAFPEFCTWLAAHPNLCITQAQYDTRISQYGECPFYVYNVGADTVRLPKLVNYIKMASTAEGISQKLAGLPNITGTVDELVRNQSTNVTTSGAFSWTNHDVDSDGGENRIGGQLNFNAANSNAIYGRSSTVTPAHITLFPWVTVYNVARPASEAQAAEFIGSLSGKADKDLGNIDNVTATAKHTIITWGMPDYSAGVSISSTGSYTPTTYGVIRITTNDTNSRVKISLNGVPLIWAHTTSSYTDRSSDGILVEPTQTYTIEENTNCTMIFYPLKGAN